MRMKKRPGSIDFTGLAPIWQAVGLTLPLGRGQAYGKEGSNRYQRFL